jgi:site-specific recombinase XerD
MEEAMFEKLYQNQDVINRHRRAPYSIEREWYLACCEQEGYAQATLIVMANELLWSAQKINIDFGVKISIEHIKRAANDWNDRERCCRHSLNTRWTSDRFIRTTKQWLRFLGLFEESETQPVPFYELVNDFTVWMDRERGLAPSTINVWSRYIKQFLDWYQEQGQSFEAIDITDVDSYLALGGKKGWCRVTVANRATSLRAFFRYAETRGWCRPSIAKGIMAPCIYSQEGLPLGPSWNNVQRLIASMDTQQPSDIRNRAIVMLFAVYGMRASEVSKLRLDDIDWQHDRILVPRVKRRRPQNYPLEPAVGNAIVRYLTEVRQTCAYREIFLTLFPPFRSISRGGLYSLTRRSMAKLGIEPPHRGPHSLRHACASRLISEGLTIKEIGDHLGHRSTSATRIYAKVDIAGLREVATFDLGGLI